MNLNKLLCKHFDEDGKGEVTVEDVLDGLIWKSIPFILVALYIHGAISAYKTIYVWAPDYTPPFGSLVVPGILVFILATVGLVVVGGLYTTSKILEVRIVKCEREDGDEPL